MKKFDRLNKIKMARWAVPGTAAAFSTPQLRATFRTAATTRTCRALSAMLAIVALLALAAFASCKNPADGGGGK